MRKLIFCEKGSTSITKSLLLQIKERFVYTSDLQKIDRILSDQSNLLYAQMESLHTSSTVIEACREVI
jgi:hypothetical protein